MNYGRINKTDIANGPGVRVSLFVSGCRNQCEGCFNKVAWDFNYGTKYTAKTFVEIDKALAPNYIEGLTILGGEPFEAENIETVTKLCEGIRLINPSKSIWVYTGYKYQDLKNLEIMKYIDVLVDGPFLAHFKDISLKFRGSTNQRIIDVKETRKAKSIKLWAGIFN